MRNKKVELDVDLIGNQKDTLTTEEEKMISDFIRSRKKKVGKSSKKKINA